MYFEVQVEYQLHVGTFPNGPLLIWYLMSNRLPFGNLISSLFRFLYPHIYRYVRDTQGLSEWHYKILSLRDDSSAEAGSLLTRMLTSKKSAGILITSE